MSIPDPLMKNYFRLLTDLSEDYIASLIDANHTHPRQAKEVLAKIVVESFYDRHAANTASSEFRRRFSEHQLPSNIETRTAPISPIGIVRLIRHVGFATSNSDARRLIEQGGVTFADKKITDPNTQITIGHDAILKVGKRRVCKITVETS